VGLDGCLSALTRSAQQLVRDHLVTVGILAQRRELAANKNVVQIRDLGIPSRASPFELIA
jgi:hypothetical protein